MVVKLCQSVCRLGHQLFDKPLLQIENNSRHVKLGILHETLVKSFLIGMCWQQVLFAVYGKWIILISGITRKKKTTITSLIKHQVHLVDVSAVQLVCLTIQSFPTLDLAPIRDVVPLVKRGHQLFYQAKTMLQFVIEP